jgi:ferredoxin
MNFGVNTQPDRDWATHPFSYRDDSGDVTHTELAFTFADYALLVPKLRSHFRLIPDNFESESLSPVAEYLTHNETTRFSLIPFVWTMNRDNVMHRAVVSRELILACRDRLNYWHTLQEIAGVKSPHIEQAINDTTLTLEAKKNSEISELKAVHISELQELQDDATTKVMGQLAQVLMGMNPAAMQGDSTSSKIKSSSPAKSEESTTEESAEQGENETVAAIEPAAEVSEDPWIETMLCTTCNDCTNMNPQMFVYNDDKQAYIADPNAGTYAELVEAAEICPSRCIHPGLPLNSSEADLDELIERAAPFNQI